MWTTNERMGGPHTRTLPTMPRTHVLFILVPTTRQLSSLCRAGNKIRKQNNQLILADSSERERKNRLRFLTLFNNRKNALWIDGHPTPGTLSCWWWYVSDSTFSQTRPIFPCMSRISLLFLTTENWGSLKRRWRKCFLFMSVELYVPLRPPLSRSVSCYSNVNGIDTREFVESVWTPVVHSGGLNVPHPSFFFLV